MGSMHETRINAHDPQKARDIVRLQTLHSAQFAALFWCLECAAILGALTIGVAPANAESGYQTIQGTRVFTVIDHNAGVATFSNDCGSQTLTQRQLQAGAIPSQIMPCPRSTSQPQPQNPPISNDPVSQSRPLTCNIWLGFGILPIDL